MTTLVNTSIRHLFPTPFIMSELPPDMAADINPRLTRMLLDQEKTMPTQSASNRGGWQSDDKILRWGGADIAAIVAALTELVDEVTVHYNRSGTKRGGVAWKINGWGNINRKGNANAPHIHPGAYWSAVYYVAVEATEQQGGDLLVSDPRGGLSLMYCPVLRVGLDGYLTAGHSETHRPKAGQCVIFPSWLSHQVTPYTGDGERISLAFNFAV